MRNLHYSIRRINTTATNIFTDNVNSARNSNGRGVHHVSPSRGRGFGSRRLFLGSVTGSKFGLLKTQQCSCVVKVHSRWGCWCKCRQIPAFPLHMHSAFPTEKGQQTTLMSFGDVIIFLLIHLGRGYKRKAHKSLKAVVWVSGTE